MVQAVRPFTFASASDAHQLVPSLLSQFSTYLTLEELTGDSTGCGRSGEISPLSCEIGSFTGMCSHIPRTDPGELLKFLEYILQ